LHEEGSHEELLANKAMYAQLVGATPGHYYAFDRALVIYENIHHEKQSSPEENGG
jgi:hypothetical protein